MNRKIYLSPDGDEYFFDISHNTAFNKQIPIQIFLHIPPVAVILIMYVKMYIYGNILPGNRR